MHRIDGVVLLSPTDLVANLECAHLTQLELAVTRGEVVPPERHDPELELLRKRGEMHEKAHLDALKSTYEHVVEIADRGETIEGQRRAAEETYAAMRDGADVIYQASFFDGRWRGRADFLHKVDTPSTLGSWSYEVSDTKLARSVKVAALLQMCEYSRQVERLQGVAPRHMTVVLGDGRVERFLVADVEAYHRNARRRLEELIDGDAVDTYPEPVGHCNVCRWLDRCTDQRRRDDHLSQVAGMRRDHTRRLVTAGFPTLASLAAAPEECSADIGDASWQRLRGQAQLQLHERSTGEQRYELLAVDDPGLGLAALPPPSSGDLFFDMEGDPWVQEVGLEYLFGISEIVDGRPEFHAFWGHDSAEEKAAFEHLIDFITVRLDRDPTLHVYHYASYEAAALKRLMNRHSTREEEVDRLLRGGVLVDLYRAVIQGVRVSKDSYSLKSLEAFYMPKRTEAIADAVGSIVAYERWRDDRDPALLRQIEEYNRRDCESTWQLREWLEGLRNEREAADGRPVPRPPPRDGTAPEAVATDSAETAELVAALVGPVSDEPAVRDAEARGRWLLAQLLGWHRREAKSEWWAYFDRLLKTDEQLVDDRESIGAITHLATVGPRKRSVVERYGFDPSQEYKLDVGKGTVDPRSGKFAGTIVALDPDLGTLDLARQAPVDAAPHPTSLVPTKPLPAKAMQEALQRVARQVIDGGVSGPGPYRAGRDLLLGGRPRVTGHAAGTPLLAPGEEPVAATCRLVGSLDNSYLAVQGPPGCGKTFTGAHVAVELVRRGCRVGVCATTHRAIGQLLDEIARVAERERRALRMLQRCDDGDRCSAPGVAHTRDSKVVVSAVADGEVDVVGGTPWLFAIEALDTAFDAILIDESGQMSLANAIAVSTATRNLVLLGDPQQLAQPSHGLHPDGADVSALQHVLQGSDAGSASDRLVRHDTIAPEDGVFLPTTRRMHPDVCRFVSTTFYDGRLEADPVSWRRRISGGGALHGTGLRLAAQHHEGNRTWSSEEVELVASLVGQLHGTDWTDGDGPTRPLGLSDILVVAPYNAQVKRLRERLPDGARAGTVDKFQGQEAPVAIYSMATSSADDIPRNVDFLFSRNRLNVAVSRAQALAIVVCSPELLLMRCRTPDQLRLVNALCRYVDMATPI